MAAFVETLLKKEGHTVRKVFDGAKALEILGVKEASSAGVSLPDLIVLDVMMPEVDGFTVARLLDKDPNTSAIPILMLTAKGQPGESADLPPNIKLYLEKPFDPESLCEMVSVILEDSGKSAPPQK